MTFKILRGPYVDVPDAQVIPVVARRKTGQTFYYFKAEVNGKKVIRPCSKADVDAFINRDQVIKFGASGDRIAQSEVPASMMDVISPKTPNSGESRAKSDMMNEPRRIGSIVNLIAIAFIVIVGAAYGYVMLTGGSK